MKRKTHNLKTKVMVLIMCTFLLTLSVRAADLVRVMPVTDKILMVVFDEGHLDYQGKGKDRFNGITIYADLMDPAVATTITNYSLSSPDDNNYSSPQTPISIGRKSKGTEFNNIYDFPEPEYLSEHLIYIELPNRLVDGRTYTLHLNSLASNLNEYTFEFDIYALRSETIHVNQIGFTPNAPKYAYLSHYMGDFNNGTHTDGGLELDDYSGNNFYVVNYSNNQVVFTGTINSRTQKTNQDFTYSELGNVTHADVWECDFSSFTTPGEYKIVVEDIGCSFPFEIKTDAYREAYYYASKGMFAQRSGIVQDLGYYEAGLEYPRDFHPDDGYVFNYYPDNSGHSGLGTTPGTVDNIWGWYHDAGDWDGYLEHYRVPFSLLLVYDLKPSNFGDGDLGNRYKLSDTDPWIDEGNNGIPDILDEASWLIKFYKRSKDALQAAGFSDGGVPGYVGVNGGDGSDHPSWEDTRTQLALKGGDIVRMTFIYSAGAAWLASCMQIAGVNTLDGLSVQDWINEAEAAYTWASNAGNDNKTRAMATAALYRATGDAAYQDDFISRKNSINNWGTAGNWGQIHEWHFAAWIYTQASHGNLNSTEQQNCINDITNRADKEVVTPANDRGYRWGLEKSNNWKLGTFSTPHIVLGAMAYELTGQQQYLDACYTTADYHLGGNELNMVWLTHVGEKSEQAIYHIDSRMMFDFSSQAYTEPYLPGFVPYGGHENCDWQAGCSYEWVGDEDFSRTTSYPNINNFPQAEARFLNRHGIAGSEFTVHQTQNQAILAYGYLCDTYSQPFTPNQRPTVSLNLNDGQSLDINSPINLTVNASNDTRRVEYYYDWHLIGESTDAANDFAFEWDALKYRIELTDYLITAKAFDDKGLESYPSDGGDKSVTLTSSTSQSVTEVIIARCPPSTMIVSETFDLDATVNPSYAADKSITWSSGNTSVATVDANGLITAVGPGTTNITVTTNDGGFTDNCSITVSEGVFIYPIQDFSLKEQKTSVIHSTTELRVRNPSDPANLDRFETFLKFDLSAIAGSVSEATLKLHVYNVAGNYGSSTHTYSFVEDDSYDESTIAWPDKPASVATMGTYSGFQFEVTPEIDITSYVDQEASGDDILSIRISGSNDGYVDYTSVESNTESERPVIKVLTGGSGSTVSVTGVSIDNCPTGDLSAGGTFDLNSTVSPSNASNKSVSWSSSNTGVATVNGSGVVTAVASGTATITVTTSDGGFTDTCTITVSGGGSSSDWVEDFQGMNGATEDTGATAWSIIPSGSGAFSVSGGEFHASGTITEAVWQSEVIDISGSVDISVDLREEGGIESGEYVNVYYKLDGGSEQVIGEYYDDFTSATASISGISGSTVQIIIRQKTSASNEDHYWDNVTVIGAVGSSNVAVTGITMNNCPTSDLAIGDTYDIDRTISPSDATNKTTTWTSSNTSVATVNSGNGVVTAVAAGTTTITATTEDGGYTATCTVTVTSGSTFSNWIEDFEGMQGATEDTGATAWSITPSGSGAFSVSAGEFHASGTVTEAVWQSEVIDISGSVDISVDLREEGGIESGEYVNVYYKLDGGSEQVIGEYYDDFTSATASVSGISGSTVQIVIRQKTSKSNEDHYWDNVSVTASNPTARVMSSVETLASSDLEIDIEGLSVYPNPTDNILYLTEKASIVIMDLQGRIMISADLVQKVDVSHLSPGLYVVRLDEERLIKLLIE